MSLEEKYRMLRTALLAILRVEDDDKGRMLAAMDLLNRGEVSMPEGDKLLLLQAYVALLETHSGDVKEVKPGSVSRPAGIDTDMIFKG